MKKAAVILAGVLSVGASAQLPPDPYIWLEDVSSPRSLAWVDAENAQTVALFEKDRRYPALFADALKIAEATDRIPMPELIGGNVTNFWQDKTHVRGIWRTTTLADYRSAAPHWRTLLDLDALSAADKANYVWKGANCEPVAERRCMIALSDGGEDATVLREFDLGTGHLVDGGFNLPTSKQNVVWEDPDTLLVARDWGPGTMTAAGYAFVVKRLHRGQPLSAAHEVYRGTPQDGGYGVYPFALIDGQGHRATGIVRTVTTFESEIHLFGTSGMIKVDAPPKLELSGLVDGKLIFNLASPWPVAGKPAIPAGAVVAVDAAAAATGKPLSPETVFMPNARQSVDGVEVTRSAVIATIYDNVRGRAYSFKPVSGGWQATRLALPDNASVDLVASDPHSDDAFFSVASFLTPTTLWQGEIGTSKIAQIKAVPARFDASNFVTEQFEATSKDGTKIPYFVTHRKGVKLDGTTPTILTAYGGFQVSETPSYRAVTGKLWMERGGAYAVANIRGGGEFGPAWHEAALKTKRQNAYDDFAAVGEDLIARKLTSPRRLGISGGSNGGLLMGVEMTQRPDLWHAVEIDVPLLDMLRIEKIAAGASWVGEYGSVANPDELAFWQKVSPYQQLRKGVAYPTPYIFTTTKDDRVGPVHARKFAARMKELALPYYYYENTEGGHGAGANLKQVARTTTLGMIYFTRMLMD
ncbi:prolyl oligopeptidase family serine peptidase [Sphingosinicellaceae bacterium]|nr:prolyl oligopeptidase family serine peptidase [Sphingosinicellaceae bacterium]